GGAAVAAAQAAADSRFTLIRVDGGGPGFARNQGIRHARGEYLSFVDGDDMLPPHALERLLRTLETSGSDFVSGNVQRLGPSGVTQSALHANAVKTAKTGTHISRSPELFYDVSVWNKLFRRSFFDGHGLTFPEGVVWEDLQLMTKAHVLARAVDVVTDHIYYWRVRADGEPSITQSRTSIANFRDRITALEVIDDFLRPRKPRHLLHDHQRKALVNDLWLYIPDLTRTSEAYRAEFSHLMAGYLARVDKRVLRQLPSTHKLAYHLAGRGMMPELLAYAAWLGERPVTTVPVARGRGRIRADLPFRTDPRLVIPPSVYHIRMRELDPVVRVEDIFWQDGKLVISGCAFVPSVDIRRRLHTAKLVVLRPRKLGGPPILVLARSFRHPEAQRWSGQQRYDYDWAGFEATISPRRFRLAGRWRTGEWAGYVLVRGHGVWRASRLHTPVGGGAERPAARQVAPGIRLGAAWRRRRLHIEVARTEAELHRCERRGEDIVFEVDMRQRPGPAARLVLARPDGTARSDLATTATGQRGGGIRLRAPVSASLPGDAGAAWDLCVECPGAARVPVAFPAGGHEYRFPAGSDEVAIERTRHGNVAVIRHGAIPVISDYRWSAGGRLSLRGRYGEFPAAPLEAVLQRVGTSEIHAVPVERAGDSFGVTVSVAAMPVFGRRQPLRDGEWELKVRLGGRRGEAVAPGYDHDLLANADDRPHRIGPKRYRFTAAGRDSPVLTVDPAVSFAEQGRVQRRVLRAMYYPLQQRRGLRDAVVFLSFKGRQVSDNPLGIAAELRRRGDTREHIWVVNDWAVPVPDGARAVLLDTEACWDALARSAYLVSNDDMPRGFTKRPGQLYLQTWHGTPLKRIGFDVAKMQSVGGSEYLRLLAHDIACWDVLLSPSPVSTPILQRAFRFGGEVLESGYPRNDILASDDGAAIAARARERIGVPAGKRVVMYAPTWRDNQFYASGRYRFDLRLDLDRAWHELGDDYVILLRGHHQMADDVPAGARRGFVVNVTGYPDVAELFLASDALITDYSSMMCDFAVTGRPMLFFTYDLTDYRDSVRGLYVDLEREAPGPLLASSDEVIGAIGSLETISARYQDAYAAFVAKFCPLDDGKAGARVCDRLFGG
ncbi:MAG: CDP-glycerol glycerophosphotransferase family protein, partial [Streptosporangiaceae bacterium]